LFGIISTGWLFVFFTVLNGNSLYASNLDDIYDKLKNASENFNTVGTICEQVAKLSLQEKYPEPEYEIITGIVYYDPYKKKVMGELDLVVFENQNHKAVFLGEVKCKGWAARSSELKYRNAGLSGKIEKRVRKQPLDRILRRANREAHQQLARFKSIVKRKKPVDLYLLSDPSVRFELSQFEPSFDTNSISFKDSGFDIDLDLTIEELMELRSRLLIH
jgi:hypothetical protein